MRWKILRRISFRIGMSCFFLKAIEVADPTSPGVHSIFWESYAKS